MSEVRHTDPQTGGQKGVKPERFELIPWDAMEEVARVYGAGPAKKGYDEWNWLRGYSWSLSLGAAFRHLAKFSLGYDYDTGPKGTNCHHLACAAWHCLTMLTFFLRHLGTDDRKKSPVIDSNIWIDPDED